ncbi:MAG: dihydroorotate dehydrogenase electron transfer subunit [Christensenellales bacterium]|jgi:dihydroorotate dehydrogenase electron transfer subunit
MIKSALTITHNTQVAHKTWRMVLTGQHDCTTPGQFINLSLPGFYLRRPFSVCDWTDSSLTVYYKVMGQGTDAMTTLAPGTMLDALTGLGNGFDKSKSGDAPLLMGGGVGVPPLYRLCRELIAQGKSVRVALGFGSAREVFLADQFAALGAQVQIATMDGSQGVAGVVLDACRMDACSYFYACGPLPMLKAVCQSACTPGQVSLEERMGCGFGACMGCTIITKDGPRRVCHDGPVFESGVLTW